MEIVEVLAGRGRRINCPAFAFPLKPSQCDRALVPSKIVIRRRISDAR